MRVATAMLPEASKSQDRVFTTSNAVVILDGASPFVPVAVSTSTYVDTLGRFLVEGLTDEPRIDLTDLLAEAIRRSAALLELHPGSSPSSAVAVARENGNSLDLLVLGDCQIATPRGIYVDNRISLFAKPQRTTYRARLAGGRGYDETHRELLRALQAEQARHRNTDAGFWIAEAVPRAASHAVSATLPVASSPWLVLATDGAYRPIAQLQSHDWAAISELDDDRLDGLLRDLQEWEAREDPDGAAAPRAKRHDDKAIATVRL